MIKNLILDVDGVMTTGQFLYSEDGKAYKIFGPHDADGLKILRNKLNILFHTKVLLIWFLNRQAAKGQNFLFFLFLLPL